MPRSGDCTGHEAASGDEPSADEPAATPEDKTERAPPGAQLDPGMLAKLKELGAKKLPPDGIAPEDIRMADFDGPDRDRKPLMAWRNAAGTWEYTYSAAFHEANAASKFARIKEWEPEMPGVRDDLIEAMESAEPGSREHAAATVAAIISVTGMRPGSAESLRRDHYGATTLLGGHVSIDGNRVDFEFVGKSGKLNPFHLDGPPSLVSAIRDYRDVAGDDGPMFPATRAAAVKDALPGGLKVKDMRTVVGTETARTAVDSLEPPPPPLDKDPRKARRQVLAAVKTVSETVAKRLNNTPAVAKASYIHPDVFRALEERLGVTDEIRNAS